MLNLNRAQILGNMTKDPEMRYTPNGQAVTSFSVATNRKWKGRDGAADGEATEYHDIVVWGKQAEAVTPMLKKGGPVFVEGRLQTRSWEGQDGVKRYKTEIVADNVIVLNSRSGGSMSPANAEAGAPSAEASAPAQENPVEEIAPDAPKKSDDEIDIEEIPF
jgi:single-strand DNA-binding protein